jgi:hypothetical protein
LHTVEAVSGTNSEIPRADLGYHVSTSYAILSLKSNEAPGSDTKHSDAGMDMKDYKPFKKG